MSDRSDVPRYGLRKRPASDVPSHKKVKQNRPSSRQPHAPSGVARPLTPKPGATTLTPSPMACENMTTQVQEQLAPRPSTDNACSPHRLKIRGRTFTGPLPPDRITDPLRNAASIPGDHTNYKLFVCADCPIHEEEKQPDLHALCYPSHPCL